MYKSNWAAAVYAFLQHTIKLSTLKAKADFDCRNLLDENVGINDKDNLCS